jgi:DNA-binding SARP family transcriptional activator
MTLAVTHPFDEWTDKPDLRIHAFGPGRVERLGRVLKSSDWTYSKAREMLFYLICHAAKTKEQIGLALWPDVTADQLNDNFRISLHHLRKALGGPDWVLYEGGRYAFNRALPYWFDVEAFEFSLSAAQPTLEGNDASMTVAADHLERAASLYRGEFLDGAQGEWCLAVRESLLHKHLEGLVLLGDLLLKAGELVHAKQVYRQAIAKDGYLEAAHRGLMRCLVRQGELSQALRHYRSLAALLQAELAAPPDPETVALHERQRRGDQS